MHAAEKTMECGQRYVLLVFGACRRSRQLAACQCRQAMEVAVPERLGGDMIAAANIFVAGGAPHLGPEAPAVLVGAAIGRWRNSLLVGMAVSVTAVLVLRATIAA